LGSLSDKATRNLGEHISDLQSGYKYLRKQGEQVEEESIAPHVMVLAQKEIRDVLSVKEAAAKSARLVVVAVEDTNRNGHHFERSYISQGKRTDTKILSSSGSFSISRNRPLCV
jgi:hypothetical protein